MFFCSPFETPTPENVSLCSGQAGACRTKVYRLSSAKRTLPQGMERNRQPTAFSHAGIWHTWEVTETSLLTQHFCFLTNLYSWYSYIAKAQSWPKYYMKKQRVCHKFWNRSELTPDQSIQKANKTNKASKTNYKDLIICYSLKKIINSAIKGM